MLTGVWWGSYILLWVFMLLIAAVVLAVARQVGVLQARMAPTGARMTNVGLEVGDTAPILYEPTLSGEVVTLGVERRRPTLLMFVTPRCPACTEVTAAVRNLHRHERRSLDIIFVSLSGDEVEDRGYVEQHRLSAIPFVSNPRVADTYHVAAAPHAILVDTAGKIHTKGMVNNGEHLESLLNALEEGVPTLDSKIESQTVANRQSGVNALPLQVIDVRMPDR